VLPEEEWIVGHECRCEARAGVGPSKAWAKYIKIKENSCTFSNLQIPCHRFEIT